MFFFYLFPILILKCRIAYDRRPIYQAIENNEAAEFFVSRMKFYTQAFLLFMLVLAFSCSEALRHW